MAQKKQVEQKVLNKITWVWEGEDGEVHTYEKRLRPPKGRLARQMMPRVLRFMGEVADITEGQKSIPGLTGQLGVIEKFWTDPAYENELFPFILQLETDEERRIVDEELTMVEIIQSITEAAQYLISESFQRKDVQEALKKSDGGEPSPPAAMTTP